ncbi:MAG: universal stress protein [Acidobacteria bacterium]|nr:universal stress protein [Acidobacteriota bacterium]
MAGRMKILIAYDGSACADAALDGLRRAGLPNEVEFKVLSVIENWLPPPSGLEIVEHIDRDQEYMTLAMQAAQRIHQSQPGWEAKAEVGIGSPASIILEKADEWNPDLIVVGAHGRSAVGRLFFGSVSQKVLHEANCSVRVAREPMEESDRPVRLVIGFDGSPSAKEVVRVVTARHWPEGCEVRVVYAAWPSAEFTLRPAVGKIADWIAEEDLRAKTKVDAMVRDLNIAGLRATAVIKAEEPKRLLLSEAENWKADCLFVGARGLGRFQRLRLGSVSSAVAARARCSVEVIHTQKMP